MAAGGAALQAQLPPTRPLGAIIATSPDAIGRAARLRVEPDGRVIGNDPFGRRLFAFDKTLQNFSILADTTPATSKAYGRGLAGLTSFTADSMIVMDDISGAFVVLDPAGKVTRVIPLERQRPGTFVRPTEPTFFDQHGHIVFRAPPPVYLAMLDPDFIGDTLMVGPDSMPILRLDPVTRHADTLAMLKVARVRQFVTRRAGGGGSGRPAYNPIPSADDWTVLHDGTLAIIRVSDYHVDFVTPDKRITSGPPIPTTWISIDAARKKTLMDSLRTILVPGSFPATVEPSDLPDRYPPFVPLTAQVDPDDHIWVRQAAAGHGGPVYDVIDRSGKRLERVQFAGDWLLIGFGDGAAYLVRSGPHGPVIAKARLH